MNTLKLHIPAIHCGHCVHTISMEVGELDGVENVAVDESTKMATISFGPPASEDEIRGLLSEINYPAED
jgi:copper chaperone CopZ